MLVLALCLVDTSAPKQYKIASRDNPLQLCILLVYYSVHRYMRYHFFRTTVRTLSKNYIEELTRESNSDYIIDNRYLIQSMKAHSATDITCLMGLLVLS